LGSPSIHRIERLNYVLGGVGTLIAAFTQPGPVVLGLAVGAALTCANFFVLRKLVTRWTNDAQRGRTSNTQILMLPKMIGLLLAAGLSIVLLPIDPIAFTVGYSIFILSIIIDTTYAAMRTEDEPATNGSKENDHG